MTSHMLRTFTRKLVDIRGMATASAEELKWAALGMGEKGFKGRVVVVTSGKGGVGKTTSSASIAYGLAMRGKKTIAIDFDIGLRNLDLHLGLERKVAFDFINVLMGECTLDQALLAHPLQPNLRLLAASQTRDKTALSHEGVAKVIHALRQEADYIVCDSPAGLESGALNALYFADEAIITANAELSSVRDSDKMLGLLTTGTARVLLNLPPPVAHLLLNRYQPAAVEEGFMMSSSEVTDLLGVPVVGVIPESTEILRCTNLGEPVITSKGKAGQAYGDTVDRFLGADVPFRFLLPEKGSFLSRLFGTSDSS